MLSLSKKGKIETWSPSCQFELTEQPLSSRRRNKKSSNALPKSRPFASATSALSDKFLGNNSAPPCPPPPSSTPKVSPPLLQVSAQAAELSQSGSRLCHHLHVSSINRQTRSGHPAGGLGHDSSGKCCLLDWSGFVLEISQSDHLVPDMQKMEKMARSVITELWGMENLSGTLGNACRWTSSPPATCLPEQWHARHLRARSTLWTH